MECELEGYPRCLETIWPASSQLLDRLRSGAFRILGQEKNRICRGFIRNVCGDTNGRIHIFDFPCEEAISSFERPGFVETKEMRLAITACCLSLIVDHKDGIVILRGGWPLRRDVYLFWISDNDSTAIFQGDSASPKACDTGSGWFEVGIDVL